MHGQEPEQPVRRVVDSTAAIAFARLFMPVALAVIGFFMVTTLTDIKTQIAQTWANISKLNESFQKQAIDMATMKVKVDDTGLQVNQLQVQVGDLQRQVHQQAAKPNP